MGELQAANAAVSSRHWKLDPASVELKSKLAEVELVVPLGPESIVVSGGVVSGGGGLVGPNTRKSQNEIPYGVPRVSPVRRT